VSALTAASRLSRRPLTRTERGSAALEAALVPVVDALITTAEARVRDECAAAEAGARGELERARTEAARLLDEARADGARAAERTAAMQLAKARRAARETVLSARRRAYDTLRRSAVEALVQRASTPEGRWLGERLAVLVRDRVGPSASAHRAGRGQLEAVAEAGHRRAVLGPGELVDQVLESLATEIEALWA